MPEFQSGMSDFSRPSAIVTGSFDGLHHGHRYLFDKLRETARSEDLASVVFTFEPHPSLVLNPAKAPRLLTTLEERKKLFADIPVDKVIFYPFEQSFAGMTGKEFIDFLKRHFNLQHLIVGYDHRFGSDRLENQEQIKRVARDADVRVSFFPPLRDDEGNIISSSRIRRKIQERKIREANALLGYDYMLSGEVVHGSKFGRKIGFPTANLSVSDRHKLIPPEGVYFVKAEIKGKYLPGVMNIGKRPTVNTNEKNILPEVHLLDYDGDLYGKNIRVYFKKFHRQEEKFPDTSTLKERIASDVRSARQFFRIK